jgi:Spy/CpxP family protein refolding chaperone
MVIFACGIFTGVFVTRIQPVAAVNPVAPTPMAVATNKGVLPGYAQLQMQRPEFLKRMDRQLDLTPEQHDAIARIMKDSQDRTIPIWEKVAPQMNDELKRVRDEIRQVLTPEQRKRWTELMRRTRPGRPAQQTQPHPPDTNSL